jgi:hypothetical protein
VSSVRAVVFHVSHVKLLFRFLFHYLILTAFCSYSYCQYLLDRVLHREWLRCLLVQLCWVWQELWQEFRV